MTDKEKVLAKKPDIRPHNDGQDFICMDCGTVIHRTRSNPFPEHKCKADKEKVLAKWPDARECYTFQYGEEIKAVGSGDRQIHGTGKTVKAAWADAARRLEDVK